MSSGKEIQRRVKTGCITCRKRHMKCDERKPQCKHCEIARRSCLYDFTVKRKQSSSESSAFHFAPDHVWLETPNEVTFVHHVKPSDTESNDTPFSPNAASGSVVEHASPVSYLRNGTSVESPNTTIVDGVSMKDRMEEFTADHTLPPINWASPYSNASGSSVDDDPVNSVIVRRLSGSSIYTRGPRKPMTDPKAARLLHHYIDHLASWLDINDPQRHFTTFVPHLALSCPILLHAILAFSASHLARLDSSCDALTAVEYHDACVQGLIPALANPSTAMDNVLPLSTVILRMYEMMSYETDHQRHLRGCSSLFTHNRGNIGFRALKRTAFWTYVREEILVALPNSSPTNIRPKSWKNDIVWEGDTDYVRTNQITWLAAEVVDFCFGDPAEANVSNWDELQREIDQWSRTLPETFQPLYITQDTVPFPEISYLCTWHVVGMQFYHLAKVLLALHNPHHTSGLDFLHFARSVEAEILKHTIQLCGMTKALGSKHPGVLVNAVQPLVLCGRCLKKEDEQLELVRMLRQIEQDTAWSTAQGIQSLQEAWAAQVVQ